MLPRHAVGGAALHLRDQPACLGLGIGEAHHLDRHADRLGRPQRLAEPALVLGDHRVGGGQDVPGGAEVLLQPHLPGLREVVREAADILDVRASKAVHRLVVVPHDEDLAVPGREQAQPRVLGVAHVLVLVRQHAVEASGPALPVGRVALHGDRRPEQQVAEVGRVRLAQPALILGVDPRHQAQAVRVHRTADQAGLGDPGLDPGRRLLRRHQVVLELADLPADQLDRVAVAAELGRVHRHRLEHALDQPLAVVGVQDVEAGAQARHLRLRPQLAGAEAVEGAAPGWHRLPGQHGRMRSVISPAALLVKVTARMRAAGMPRASMRQATPEVRVLVLPVPAPASTSTGPSRLAASACAGVRPARMEASP